MTKCSPEYHRIATSFVDLFDSPFLADCCLSQKGSIRPIDDVRRLNNGIDGGAVERQGPETWVENYPL